jgi:hypothetical protein
VADALVPAVPRLPLLTQGAVALALTQLQYYNADVLEAIAASILSSLEADAAQQQQPPAAASPSQKTGQPGDASVEGPPVEALTQSFAEVQPSSLPGVVLTLVAGFSLSGHYSEPLFNGLVDQVGEDRLIQGTASSCRDCCSASCALLCALLECSVHARVVCLHLDQLGGMG